MISGGQKGGACTSEEGDAIAMARSTAAGAALQLELIQSPAQILLDFHGISHVRGSHQLIQWLCLRGREKLL